MTTDPTALYRDALAAVLDAIDVPLAAIDGDHGGQRKALLDRRAAAASEAIKTLLAFEEHPDLIAKRVEDLRVRTSQLPVTYRRYVGDAAGHPAACIVCGPGCCSPVFNVHASCPGPLVGRTVASVR